MRTRMAATGERYFARGVDYLEEGTVGERVPGDACLGARVAGTLEYSVRLWADGERFGCRPNRNFMKKWKICSFERIKRDMRQQVV